MSSPVLAIVTSESAPATSSMPRASLAPPVPPARMTTGPLTPASFTWSTRREAGDPDPGPYLVAHVDRDDQGGELLEDPCRLERPAIHGAKPRNRVDQL